MLLLYGLHLPVLKPRQSCRSTASEQPCTAACEGPRQRSVRSVLLVEAASGLLVDARLLAFDEVRNPQPAGHISNPECGHVGKHFFSELYVSYREAPKSCPVVLIRVSGAVGFLFDSAQNTSISSVTRCPNQSTSSSPPPSFFPAKKSVMRMPLPSSGSGQSTVSCAFLPSSKSFVVLHE
jgi:hypothetical protein